MLRKTTVALIVIVIVVCAGCESHAESKKGAKERWDRTSARIKLGLAQQQYDNGKYEQAAKIIKECLSADPEIPQAHLLLGKLLLTEDKMKGATDELQVAVELDKELHEGWYWLGVIAQESRDYKRAYEYYRESLLLEPSNVEYILAVADVEVARNNCSEAVRLLTDKMAVLPRDVSLKVAAADLMMRIGRSDAAANLYKQAMLMTTENDDIAEALGYCYVFGDRWREASEIFEGLAGQCEDEQQKKLYLEVAAMCSMNSAQYDRAANCYGKLSVEQRDNPEIWVKMGQAALGAGLTNRALVYGQKALALRPGYADAIALIGCAQYAAGDYAAAAESFRRITTDEKNKGLSWLMRARCYEQLGQTDRAERAYKKAFAIDPDSKLGDFLAKTRGTESEDYRQAIELQTGD
jgi:Tfp pilus assembly protein PilF